MEVLTNLTVVIILQYIFVSNHHVVHLKLTCIICQLSLTKAGKKWVRWGKTSIGGENQVPFQKTYCRGIRTLGSWVFFGMGRLWTHSLTWQPGKQVASNVLVIALDQWWASMGGCHDSVQCPGWWTNIHWGQVPLSSTTHILQGWSSSALTTAAREEPHSMGGRRLGSLTGCLQIPFTYAVWQCRGAETQNPGFAWTILAMKADFSGWDLDAEA